MSIEVQFNVYITGEAIDGYDLTSAQQSFAEKFKLTTEKAQKVFQAPMPFTIKKGVDSKTANAYQKAIHSVGLEGHVEPVAPPKIDFSSLSLVPHEGEEDVPQQPEPISPSAPVATAEPVAFSCPKCDTEQSESAQCASCGIFFAKYEAAQQFNGNVKQASVGVYAKPLANLESFNGSGQERVFKTPIIAPLSVVMVILIYAGYVYASATGNDEGLFSSLIAISFDVFLLCEIGIVSLIIYNKKQLDKFLFAHPFINDRSALEMLKPIARTNMYSSLFTMLFLGLGSLTAIMTIVNYGGMKGLIVAGLSIVASVVMKWYNPSEQKVKQIECTDKSLKGELRDILDCWMNKPLPDF